LNNPAVDQPAGYPTRRLKTSQGGQQASVISKFFESLLNLSSAGYLIIITPGRVENKGA
jgi:hypothetical protein